MGLFGMSANNNSAPAPDSPRTNAGKGARGAPGAAQPERILSDDDVTLSQGRPPESPKAKLALTDYKISVAQDVVFVRETLRHKLAEYGQDPGTRMGIGRSATGAIEIDAQMAEEVRVRIEQDLNQSQAFRGAFDRLSVNQPTLDYVDNVMKLSQAYGTRNSLFDSLVSRDGNFNGLQDIAHRYQSVRQTVPVEAMALEGEKRYSFSVNARA